MNDVNDWGDHVAVNETNARWEKTLCGSGKTVPRMPRGRTGCGEHSHQAPRRLDVERVLLTDLPHQKRQVGRLSGGNYRGM
jgi:hypothetical protein